MSTSPITVFVSYSREDSEWVDPEQLNLIPQLARQLKSVGIELWHDTELKRMAGEEYTAKILDVIDHAEICLLLVSLNFAASDFINEIEIPPIRERYAKGLCKIIPVLLKPLPKPPPERLAWLMDLQMVPHGPTPLTHMMANASLMEQARVDIYEAIMLRADEMRAKAKAASAVGQPAAKVPAPVPEPIVEPEPTPAPTPKPVPPTPMPVPPPPKPPARRPAWALLAFPVVIVVVALIWLAVSRTNPPQPTPAPPVAATTSTASAGDESTGGASANGATTGGAAPAATLAGQPQPPVSSAIPGGETPNTPAGTDHPYVGIVYAPLNGASPAVRKLASASTGNGGVVVTAIMPSSPAASAGVETGDVILRANGVFLEGKGQLKDVIAQAGVGGTVTLQISRGTGSQTITVTAGQAPPSASSVSIFGGGKP